MLVKICQKYMNMEDLFWSILMKWKGEKIVRKIYKKKKQCRPSVWKCQEEEGFNDNISLRLDIIFFSYVNLMHLLIHII